MKKDKNIIGISILDLNKLDKMKKKEMPEEIENKIVNIFIIVEYENEYNVKLQYNRTSDEKEKKLFKTKILQILSKLD